MNASETLTLAADRLDTLLADVTSGPWVAHTDGLVWGQRPGDPVSGSSDVADADYIATMDPVVGRAMVAWLRSEARVWDSYDSVRAAAEQRGLVVLVSGSSFDEALALARAILGEVAS